MMKDLKVNHRRKALDKLKELLGDLKSEKVAVIADTHGNNRPVIKDLLKRRDIELIVHLGDFCKRCPYN